MIYVCAPTDVSAAVKAEREGVDEFERVTVPADLKGTEGRLLFADDWRDSFPDPYGDEVGAFVQAAHAEPDLEVEVVI